MKRTTMIAAVLAATLAAAQAQQLPAESPRGGGVGLGVQIDLGQALSALGALFGGKREPAAPDYAPQQIVAAWDGDLPLRAEDIAQAAPQLRLLAQNELPALRLRTALLHSPDPDAALEALRAWFADVVFDRNAIAQPLQGRPAPRQYAAALLGATTAPLPAAVRIGVVDGDAADAPLHSAPIARRVFGAAGAGAEHAAGVLCILDCDPRSGFAGAARGAALWLAAVLRPAGGGAVSDTYTVAQALDWLCAQQVQLINYSLGSAPDAVLALAVRRTMQRGPRLIAAAGNSGADKPLPYPAALPGVVAVAAVDAAAQPSSRGNRGPQVLLAAPGVDVWLPVPDAASGVYATGTSYAAPWVTAWMAQRLSRALPIDDASLCAAAQDLPPAGRDVATGCGLPRWPQ